MSFFSQRLRELRGDATQTAFAERLGLKQAVYSHYETCRREPDLDTLCRIVKTLGVSADYLLGLSDNKLGYHSVTASGGGSKVKKKAREKKEA